MAFPGREVNPESPIDVGERTASEVILRLTGRTGQV